MATVDGESFPWPIMDVLHERNYSLDLLMDLKHTWGQPTQGEGDLLSPSERLSVDRASLQGLLRRLAEGGRPGLSQDGISFQPPDPDGARPGLHPSFYGYLLPERFAVEQEQPQAPYLEQPVGRFMLFDPRGCFPCHTDEEVRWLWGWFLHHAGHVAMRLDPLFCLVAEMDDRVVPGLRDPRARVWPSTYYGPAMVGRLGRERVLSAPAWRVEAVEGTGGIWLHMHESPLTHPRETEATRSRVQEHLRVEQIYPPDGSGP